MQRKEKIHSRFASSYACIFCVQLDDRNCWKFSLVCALALYMLNQSKLYLGRHICLSICLRFYRSNYLCGKYKFQWRCKAETTARLFFLLAATIHQWNTERHSSDERPIVGKLPWKALWMRPSARDETKWNAKNGESLKLLILFLSCSLDEIYTTMLCWYTVHGVYILQHFPDFQKARYKANAFYVCAPSPFVRNRRFFVVLLRLCVLFHRRFSC